MARTKYDEAFASARFYGKSLDPLTVTLALRLPYDHIHRNGEPRLSRRRSTGEVHEYNPYSAGMWSMSSQKWVESTSLADHLKWLLEQLEPKAEAIRSLLTRNVEADFFCFSSGSTSTPPRLPKELRARAAALGFKIYIDHYGGHDDKDDQTEPIV